LRDRRAHLSQTINMNLFIKQWNVNRWLPFDGFARPQMLEDFVFRTQKLSEKAASLPVRRTHPRN